MLDNDSFRYLREVIGLTAGDHAVPEGDRAWHAAELRLDRAKTQGPHRSHRSGGNSNPNSSSTASNGGIRARASAS